jgi:uncharacterized protein YjiS (DUF1127 family)
MNSDVVETEVKLVSAETLSTAPRRTLPMRAMAAIGAGLARWWRSYRSEASLMNARDDVLNDMGLTRAEVEHWLSGRPYL